MDRGQKAITFALWGVLVLTMVGVVVGQFLFPRHSASATQGLLVQASDSSRGNRSGRELFPVPDLTLTDQAGQSFSTAELRGHPWVCDFVFTSCAGSCPVMSHKMAGLQKSTPAGLKLVSFTVDPEHDTPPILKEYADSLKADPSRWHFLTGTPQQMSDAAMAMKISVKPPDKDSGILHSDKFLLINGSGKVVGIYDGTNDGDQKRLAADATRLATSGGKSL